MTYNINIVSSQEGLRNSVLSCGVVLSAAEGMGQPTHDPVNTRMR